MRNSVFFLFVILFLPYTLFSYDRGDYPAWPEVDFDYHQLNLELDLSSGDNTLAGIAEYEVSPKRDGVRNLVLYADNIDISRVRIAEEEISYNQEGDSLILVLPQSYSQGERFRVEISYEATPQFGVHFNEYGTIWSSSLPKSNRHWLPGFDHPRTEVMTMIHLRVPENQQAVASGYLVGEETVENGEKLISWRSEVALPLSEIGFAAGSLEYDETFSGTKRIRIYSENGILDTEGRNIILQQAHQRIRETERYLQVEFPYDALNLIVMKDDRWETRSYAAGMAYLFSDRGELTAQVAIPVYAQWYGMHVRPEQWGDADATILHQAWLGHHFNQANRGNIGSERILDEPSSIYSNFSTDRYESFIGFLQNEQNQSIHELISSQARNVLMSGDRVMGWDSFARFIYHETGRNLFTKPEFPDIENSSILTFEVEITHENLSGDLVVEISPLNHRSEGSYTIPLLITENGEQRVQEQEISGTGGSITLSESARIDNVALGQVHGVDFVVTKPFDFWLYQLRHDRDADKRKKAARAMGSYTDEPDLQLALNSVLNRETDPYVIAAVLRAMSEITRGATGVQSWFISRLDHEHEAVQREALRALRHYPDDDIVRREVFEIISLSENISLVNEGISVYRYLLPESDYVEFIDQFLQEDSERLFTRTLIEELYNTSETNFANERVERYLQPGNPFDVRFTAFRQLDWNDYNIEKWEERVTAYIDDPDPRMRYLVVGRIGSLNYEDRERLLLERRETEHDIRVLREIMQ